MARVYTKPQTNKPYPHPETEREDLQNMLWSIGVAIPGSGSPDPHSMGYVEMTELRDMVDWQMGRVAEEPPFKRGEMTEQALEGFREYLRWRDKKDMGQLQFRVPGIPHQEVAA